MKIKEGRKYIIKGFTQPHEALSIDNQNKIVFFDIEGEVFRIPFKDILREHFTNIVVDLFAAIVKYITSKLKKNKK